MKPDVHNKLLTAAHSTPVREQVGALIWRRRRGRREVLLITSRQTRRWIIPKGWTIAGKSAAAAARIEAWEEAGVAKSVCSRKPIGLVDYSKRLKSGRYAPCLIHVYLLRVRRLVADYPEKFERRRLWVSPDKAARLVREPALKAILRQM